MANGVEIFHFVRMLSCSKRALHWENGTLIGDCKQLTGPPPPPPPNKHLVLERKERDAEIENRQDKG